MASKGYPHQPKLSYRQGSALACVCVLCYIRPVRLCGVHAFFCVSMSGMGWGAATPGVYRFAVCRLDKDVQADKGQGGRQRLVLTWGRNVQDLDSHMITPKGCTVTFEQQRCRDSALDFDVDLDIDDILYEGPETTTIRKSSKGRFSYFVNIYTPGKKWSDINANVKVYDKTGLVHNVDSPKCTGTQRWWHVVDYDPTQRAFTLINQLTDNKDPDLSKHALASATLGSAPSCSCGPKKSLPLIDESVQKFGSALVRLCRGHGGRDLICRIFWAWRTFGRRVLVLGLGSHSFEVMRDSINIMAD